MHRRGKAGHSLDWTEVMYSRLIVIWHKLPTQTSVSCGDLACSALLIFYKKMLGKVWHKETKKAGDADSLETLISKGKRYESFDLIWIFLCFEFANAVPIPWPVWNAIDSHHASFLQWFSMLFCTDMVLRQRQSIVFKCLFDVMFES